MPIYAYKCDACGHAKDVLQKMSDPLLTDCPSCRQSSFKKQVTSAGFQLKGSGWYVTDFREGAGKAGAASSDAKADSVDSAAVTASAAAVSANDSKSTDSSSAAATAKASPAVVTPAPLASKAVTAAMPSSSA
jgi:putative FmdB family regulatory protein